MTSEDLVRKTFTLTKIEEKMLEKIIQHRHPTDFRVESQTVREMIREEFERISKEKK